MLCVLNAIEADVIAFDEHPLYDKKNPRMNRSKKWEMFSTNKDPFFFHYCTSLQYWNYVAVFDSGLIVFGEDFPEQDWKSILQFDINYVLYNQFAWPVHWCVGTSAIQVCYGWESAKKRQISQRFVA